MWYIGLPIFINVLNPWLLTISNGHRLSETQQTISALDKINTCYTQDVNMIAHWICMSVWGWVEYVPFPLPFFVNASVIDPFTEYFFTPSQVASILSAPPMVFRMSSPQHFCTWWHKLLVDFASLVSRNLWTLCLQPFPRHLQCFSL